MTTQPKKYWHAPARENNTTPCLPPEAYPRLARLSRGDFFTRKDRAQREQQDKPVKTPAYVMVDY